MRGLVLALLLAACTAHGPPDTAVEQRLVWFSYLAGEDMRKCPVDRLRFVYNADFNEYVRTLDIIGEPDGGAHLVSRAYRGSQWLDVSSMGLLNAPEMTESRLDSATFGQVKRAAFDDGALGPPRLGLTLRSHEHFAIVAACADGAFHLQGYDSRTLAGIKLFALLPTLDPATGPWPRIKPGIRPPPTSADTRDQHRPYFVVRLTGAGLAAGYP